MERTDLELLAVILGKSADKVATADLRGLAVAHEDDLTETYGKAIGSKIHAAIELGRRAVIANGHRSKVRSPHDVDAVMRGRLANLQHEEFWVLCLDVRNNIVGEVKVASGGFTSCAVLPREIFAPAIRSGAVAVILVHNHPSGETAPSAEDLTLTERVVSGGRTLGIVVSDHVILGTSGHYSMRSNAVGGLS